jgi:hemoglobin-like flavoprotein
MAVSQVNPDRPRSTAPRISALSTESIIAKTGSNGSGRRNPAEWTTGITIGIEKRLCREECLTRDASVITATLERVAERVADPAPLVFQRLFAETPGLEDLFVQDTDGLVRGQMFQVTIESLLDFLGDQSYGAELIRIERMNHQGLGVEPDIFNRFYLTVMATFRDILDQEWTGEMEDVWSRSIRALAGQ